MLLKINSDLFQQLIAFLPTLANVFLCQSHLFWLTNATFYLTHPQNVPAATLAECALLGLFLEIGKLLFSWPGGMLLDKYGSKKVTLLVGFMNVFSWTMLVFSNSLDLIYIVRIVSGGVLALNFCNYTAVAGELSSPEFRGIFSSIVLLVGRFAAVFQSTVSVIFNSYKSLAISPAILSLLFLPTMRFLVESPYFLANEGEMEKARRSLEKLHPDASAAQIEEQLRRIHRSVESQRKAGSEASVWQIFARSAYRKTVLRVCLVNGFVQLSGAQIFTYYVTILLPENRFVSNVSYPLILSLTTILAQLFWTARIENFPRRVLFLVTCPLSALLWISMGTIYLYDLQRRDLWKSVVYVDAVVIMAIMGALLLPLVDIISAELFPFHIKGKANACVFLSRSVFAIVTLVVFDLIAENLGTYASFYFYAAALFALTVIVYLVLPETRGRSLVDLHSDGECETDRCTENSKLDPHSFPKYDGIESNGKLSTDK